MSGKGDKPERSPGARMLKKAKSFKDELRDKIKHVKRSPSGSRATSPTKSPRKHAKNLHRGNSFSEGTKTEKKVQKEDDVEKLQQQSKQVLQVLKYIQDVVDKNTLQMLPGSATIVIDTIMDFLQLLNSYFMEEQSTVMMSTYNKVYQSLANLIRFADNILIHGDDTLNRESATEIIKELLDGIKELAQHSIDKLEKRSYDMYKTVPRKMSASTPVSPGPESSHRNSLPDIPLTPREQEILEETSHLSSGPTGNHISRSTNDVLDNNNSLLPDSPPPKPPLPQGWQSPLTQRSNQSKGEAGDVVDGNETPPPIPAKRRTQSQSDCVDSVSPCHLTAYNSSSYTPRSQSPASSINSALSASSEDLLDDRSERSRSSSVTTSPTHSVHEARFSHYDNFDGEGPAPAQQINVLTQKINELTSSIDTEPDPLKAALIESQPPPPLPVKTGVRKCRVQSQYDNVQPGKSDAVAHTSSPMRTSWSSLGFSCTSTRTTLGTSMATMYSKQVTVSQETFSSSDTFSSTGNFSSSSAESLQKPPPLPPKKRHVHAYMEIFGQSTSPTVNDMARHSVHSINFYQTQWYEHQMEIFHPVYPRSNTISIMSDLSNPSRNSDIFPVASGTSVEEGHPSFLTSPPVLPPKLNKVGATCKSLTARKSDPMLPSLPKPLTDSITTGEMKHMQPPLVSPDSEKRSSAPASSTHGTTAKRHSSPPPDTQKDGDSDFAELNTLDDVDVSDQLIKKKQGEDGPEIRGGTVDALIVHATTAGKNDFMYQEAFLTTYRTILTPKELIEKCLCRYRHFSRMSDVKKKKLAKSTFSFLIRIVDELCTEITDSVIQVLMDLVFQLLCDGELMLARILRRKTLEKCELKKKLQEASHNITLLSSFQLTAKTQYLTDFRSENIAEQMTLLDAELFTKIEIPEVLLWAKEQSEEHSPNLTKFTEHFNKMSYWVRTRILEQEDPRERERFLMKFIKIMKYLRKLNNFNSYLAILSALDSAPVRRLEWQKQNMEALREFCQLIDSTSSFRAYRQALAETDPPCIPYIGLVLQDLTFINIGNQDFLSDNNINFAKRWQQFNILDSMRRFRKCNYEYKKNQKILAFFNNFDNYLCEESLWQISETIKPRGGKKKQDFS